LRVEPSEERVPLRAHVHARELDLVVVDLELGRYALVVARARLELRDDHAGIIGARGWARNNGAAQKKNCRQAVHQSSARETIFRGSTTSTPGLRRYSSAASV